MDALLSSTRCVELLIAAGIDHITAHADHPRADAVADAVMYRLACGVPIEADWLRATADALEAIAGLYEVIAEVAGVLREMSVSVALA